MIELSRVCFGYDGRAPLFDGLNARFEDGRIRAVLGPNGSGKSTLLRLCARQLPLTCGTITVGGSASDAPKAFARKLAYLPQSRPVPMISVRSLVAHGRFPHLGMTRKLGARDEATIDRALALTGMTEAATLDMRTLSGGQRQKAYLAMLIAQEAQHLLLDEPTTYLDVAHQLELCALLRTLRDEGRCIVLVLHDLAQAVALADDVLVLQHGTALYDGPAMQLPDSGVLERAFGVRPVLREGLQFEPL